ncbi:MAG: phosphoribosyltransferase [Nitrospirae bacterium]|nr:phosphoribosyltransferase [Nitrospirota bacterium]
MGRLIENLRLRGRSHVFRNRADAGRKLAESLAAYASSDALVLAIPAGGVPVAHEIAIRLALAMDIIIVRKVQFPDNTEAGFGAVGPDGEVIFNDTLVKSLRLSPEAVHRQVEKTKKVVEARNITFRKGRPFPDLAEKTVIIADDGLASGYTMAEAVRFAVRKKAGKIVVAVPTASESSVLLLLPSVDELHCLNVRGYPFAVAEAYLQWHDLSDEEVISILNMHPAG